MIIVLIVNNAINYLIQQKILSECVRTLHTHLEKKTPIYILLNIADIQQVNNVVVFKQISKMSRLKQIESIDSLIRVITVITQNQCSPSEQDVKILSEALERLQNLKRKKGKTNKQIHQELAKVCSLLIKFLVS
jgi:hypothetical protein